MFFGPGCPAKSETIANKQRRPAPDFPRLQNVKSTYHGLVLQVGPAKGNHTVLPGAQSERHPLPGNQAARQRGQVQVSIRGERADLWVYWGGFWEGWGGDGGDGIRDDKMALTPLHLPAAVAVAAADCSCRLSRLSKAAQRKGGITLEGGIAAFPSLTYDLVESDSRIQVSLLFFPRVSRH